MLPFQVCGTTFLAHAGLLRHGCYQFLVAFGWLLLILGGNHMVAMNFWLQLGGYCLLLVVFEWLLWHLDGCYSFMVPSKCLLINS